MADEFLPPVVAILASDISAYVTGLTEAQARMGAFVEAQAAALAELEARMAAMGAGGGAAAGVQAENDRIAASMAEVGVSAERMDAQVTASASGVDIAIMGVAQAASRAATEWNMAMAEMEGKTAGLLAELQALEAKNVAASEASWARVDASVAKSSSGIVASLEKYKKAIVGVGVVAIGATYETVKMAGNFEQSTNKLVTSAGETERGLQVVRSGMLGLAGDVGVSATHLSDAMYKVESAGYHAGAGLGVLKAAEQGAKAEGADGVKVADALSSALRDYYPHAQSAADVTRVSADVMSKFIGATSAGKMTFDDLAGSLNSILPVSSAANISLSDTLGVLASMTVHGISAEQATQNMADAIRHLQAPTGTMSKAMATLGIDSMDVAGKLGERGLSGTMQLLSDRVKNAMPPGSDKVIIQLGDALSKSTPKVQELGQKLLDGTITMGGFSKEARALDPLSAKQAASFSTLAGSYHQLGTHQISGAEVMQTYGGMMQKVMGDATGLKVALMTTGENAGYTSDAIKTISGSTADASGNVKGWSEIQGTFNQKMSEAKASMGALAITIGEQLLPVFSKIAGVAAGALHWLSQHKEVAVGLAAVIGTVLVAALVAASIAMWGFTAAALANPLVWIIVAILAAVALLAVGVYELIKHWGAVTHFFVGLWRDIEHIFGESVHWVVKTFEDWYPLILGILSGGILLLPLLIVQHWRQIVGWLAGIWHDVSSAVESAWGAIVSFFESIPHKIMSGLDSLGSLLADLATKGWDGFTHGLEVAWGATQHFLERLPYMIVFGLGFLAGLLIRLAIDGWRGFTHGLEVAWAATVKFFEDLPGNFAKFFTAVGTWLVKNGSDLIDGLKHGIEDAWTATKKFFEDLPGNVSHFFDDSGSWLDKHGSDTMSGFNHGVDDGWRITSNFLRDLPGKIWKFFVDAGVWLWIHGRRLIDGLGRGIEEAWNATVQWFYDLPGNIGRFFSDAGTWLLEAGKNIVRGIMNGVTQFAGQLWNTLKGLGSSAIHGFNAGINAHSPSLLAAESGMYLVQGIAMGIDNHAHVAVTAAKNVAGSVMGAMSGLNATAALNVVGGGVGAPGFGAVSSGGVGSGSGPTVVHVTVHVEGSVHSIASLKRAVQDAVLQHNLRNAGNGLSLARA